MTRRTRDRRGRGMRGPAVLPGAGFPGRRTRREDFDVLVLEAAQRLEARWHQELGLVEFAVEEVPPARDGWTDDPVPLASLLRGSGSTPARVVAYRRPIELRSETRSELADLVLSVVVEQVAELLGREPEEVDPDYDPD